jgi:hypothetical protein
MQLKSMRELYTTRGKMLVAAATAEELQDFLTYVVALEGLAEEHQWKTSSELKACNIASAWTSLVQ